MANVNDISSPIIELSNERLHVEVATPRGNIQHGTRFDLTGHIIQVTLDGVHTFCVPEAFNETRDTGGLGLCNEFVGYGNEIGKETVAGARYPKFGIGIIENTGEGNGANQKKVITEPFPMKVSGAGIDSVKTDNLDFNVDPVMCDGYAMALHKKIILKDNTIRIAYEVRNTGTKTLRTREYNHNFLQIDGHEIGPDYLLKFPFPLVVENLPGILKVACNEITLESVPSEPFYCLLNGFSPKGCKFELLHVPSGTGVREYDDFSVDHIAFWGRKHVICPEIFNNIELEPEQTASWSRLYVFVKNDYDMSFATFLKSIGG